MRRLDTSPGSLPALLAALGDEPDTCAAYFLLDSGRAQAFVDDPAQPAALAVVARGSGELHLFGDPGAASLPDFYAQLTPPLTVICQPHWIDSVASHLRVVAHHEIVTLAWPADAAAPQPGPAPGVARPLAAGDLPLLEQPAFAGAQRAFRRFDGPAALLAGREVGAVFGSFDPAGALVSIAVTTGWSLRHADCEAFTRPDERRQGYAGAACRALFNFLLERDRRPVWRVRHENWPGLMLARRLGLRETRPPASLFELVVEVGKPLPPPPLEPNRPFW